MSPRSKSKRSAKKFSNSSRKRKRTSDDFSNDEDEDQKKGEGSEDAKKIEQVIGPKDFFSRLPPDCIYAVCDHLEREMIDVLSAVNHSVYNTIHSPHYYKLGIRKEGCSLHFYKNAGGFGFDFEVQMWKTAIKTKKGPRGNRTIKKKAEQSEVYAYYIDRKGKERKYIDENLECGSTNEWILLGIKEAERKSPGTFPIQLYDALRAIPIRFLLKNLWLRFVIIDSTLLNTIIDLEPLKINSFVFAMCSLHKELTRAECEKGLLWLNGMNSLQDRRSIEAVAALKKLFQETMGKIEEGT